MKKESILYGIIGLLVGVIIAVFAAQTAINSNNAGMQRAMGMHTNSIDSDESMGMDNMVGSLSGKTGEEFDKLFLSEMIVHHQGAIDMAELAKKNAKHDELKKLADDIIAAQTTEIKQMKQWQLDWGYDTNDNSMGGMHTSH